MECMMHGCTRPVLPREAICAHHYRRFHPLVDPDKCRRCGARLITPYALEIGECVSCEDRKATHALVEEVRKRRKLADTRAWKARERARA